MMLVFLYLIGASVGGTCVFQLLVTINNNYWDFWSIIMKFFSTIGEQLAILSPGQQIILLIVGIVVGYGVARWAWVKNFKR